jgi:hypothetical protein
MGADSWAVRDPEGEKLRSVSGAKQTRTVEAAARAAQPAEGVETLGAGPGGTWQPRPKGPPRPQALKSPATFKRAVTDLTSPCWRDPEGGFAET